MDKITKPGLVFKRKTGESFVIFAGEEEIDIILEKIDNKKASIRVIAPKSIKVFRSELLEEYDD
jgi:sRNA-binding carbon storage regulator CsrA